MKTTKSTTFLQQYRDYICRQESDLCQKLESCRAYKSDILTGDILKTEESGVTTQGANIRPHVVSQFPESSSNKRQRQAKSESHNAVQQSNKDQKSQQQSSPSAFIKYIERNHTKNGKQFRALNNCDEKKQTASTNRLAMINRFSNNSHQSGHKQNRDSISIQESSIEYEQQQPYHHHSVPAPQQPEYSQDQK